ncbi:MAG: amidohydrolase family protein [Alphaproteobacteria bacterium]|nr:amidohydrolase family protein [Alphaproteobacteria bacterium]
MKDGLRVFDADTHVEPSAEVLDQYLDPAFRVRLDDLAPYRVPVRPGNPGSTPGNHVYRYGQISFRRILGEAAPRETHSGRDTHWMGSKMPRPGVQDNEAESRVRDMDDEGTDGHFLIPTAWTSFVGHDDVSLETGLIRAYHRHMGDFCAQYPDRLKSMIVASARDPDAAVREIREWGKSRWAVAVMPLVTKDVAVDHPSLEPVWRACVEHDLPVAHHSFTWTPPYFPGAFDLWDNIFLGRLASHPWGAMRFIAAVIGGGIMDRHPALRVATLECGFGWLPFWGRRMDEQYAYVGSTAELKMKPSEYLTSGRYFCSVERHEGADMFDAVRKFLGDEVLMYASDYPHSECQFPETVENFLKWEMPPNTRAKLMAGNATRFFKQA